MPRHLYPTKFIILSFIVSVVLHAMVLIAVYLLPDHRMTLPIPVNIVNLPPETLKHLPPVEKPVPPSKIPQIPKRIIPEKPYPRGAVPKPEKFGGSDEVTLPKTQGSPRTGRPEGADEGKEAGKPAPLETTPKQTGPLPFLSQKDIDELARKGMPERKPGDDSVTLDTDEFKFISYNRWLKVKVESVLKYPELAAVSGYQGTLYIQFDIMKDGSLGGFEVLKSSGYKILDDEAERSIRGSAPFQPLPKEWNMDRYSIRAAVVFYLGEGYIR